MTNAWPQDTQLVNVGSRISSKIGFNYTRQAVNAMVWNKGRDERIEIQLCFPPLLQRPSFLSLEPCAASIRMDMESQPPFLLEGPQGCKQEQSSRLPPPTLRTTFQPEGMEENSDLISVIPGTQAKHISKCLELQMRPSGNKKLEKSWISGWNCQANISPLEGAVGPAILDNHTEA